MLITFAYNSGGKCAQFLGRNNGSLVSNNHCSIPQLLTFPHKDVGYITQIYTLKGLHLKTGALFLDIG